ncbi:MAG TPA: MFS transporter [Clostridia bacterium]|nr:MFS transporter [Clostridia bacterium]
MDESRRGDTKEEQSYLPGEDVSSGATDDRALQSIASDETVAPQIAPGSVTMPHVVRALRHRDFRLFWGGNFLSNIGTWMQSVAQGWLVLQLAPNNSAFWLGVIGFAASAPMLVFTMIGGVIADRLDKRKLMMWTQSAMMLTAFAMWGITFTHVVNIPLIVLLAFINGLAMSLNSPSYQALVPELVPREDLANAIAMNSAQFNMSRVLGPTLGGFAMAWLGISGNFFLNALSFVAVLIALAQITYPPVYPANGSTTLWETLGEGFRYIFDHKEMLLLLVLVMLASVFGIPFVIFVPLFAKELLHLGERGFGLLLASQGVGAFLGAATIAYIRSIPCRGRFVVRAAVSFYVFIILFTFSRNFILSSILLAGIGYCMVLMVATVNTLLQHLSADEMRGRVMSMYATAFLGFAPIGSLLAGSLAETLTAPVAIAALSSIALVATIAIYYTRTELRCVD